MFIVAGFVFCSSLWRLQRLSRGGCWAASDVSKGQGLAERRYLQCTPDNQTWWLQGHALQLERSERNTQSLACCQATQTIQKQMSDGSSTLHEFVDSCKKSDAKFTFTTRELIDVLDADTECRNKGDYFEGWIKLRRRVEFGRTSKETAQEFYSTPLTKQRLNDLLVAHKIVGKTGGSSKADIVFASGKEPTSFKYLGGSKASLAAFARRSLFLKNPLIAHHEQQLTQLFNKMFGKYTRKDLFLLC